MRLKRFVSILTAFCLTLLLLPLGRAADSGATPEPPKIPAKGDVWDGVTLKRPTRHVTVDGADYYQITKCAELAYVAQNGGEWLKYNYILANDLILNDTILEWDEDGTLTNDALSLNEWTPFGSEFGSDYDNRFSGKFDGAGHTVSGLYIDQTTDYEGLFGYSENTICNLVVTNAYVKGGSRVGGIVGYQSGAMSSNYEVIDCRNDARVTGTNNVGGVAGELYYGYATNCYNIGKVICTNKRGNAGGVIGSDGAVSGKDHIAGCYYLKTDTINADLYGCGGVTSPNAEPGGFYAKNEAELKRKTTYTGWDFKEVWRIDERGNKGYPYLAFEEGFVVFDPLVKGYIEDTFLNWEVFAAPEKAKLIAARFDGERLTDVQIVSVVGDCSGTLKMMGSGETYKLILVDGTTFAPLCAAWTNA